MRFLNSPPRPPSLATDSLVKLAQCSVSLTETVELSAGQLMQLEPEVRGWSDCERDE